MAQLVKNLPAMWDTWIQSLGWEDPLEKGKVTHSLWTKLMEVMEFQLSYFKSWKMMLWKCLHSICQQIWKTQQWPWDWKMSVFILVPKKSNAKDCSNYHTIALISHASKGMLKILQARLQQYVNHELPDVQAGFRKGRGTRHQIANICWIIEKARVLEKHLFLFYWLCQSLWLCRSP